MSFSSSNCGKMNRCVYDRKNAVCLFTNCNVCLSCVHFHPFSIRSLHGVIFGQLFFFRNFNFHFLKIPHHHHHLPLSTDSRGITTTTAALTLPIAAWPKTFSQGDFFTRQDGDKERHHNHLLAGKDHPCD